MSVKIQGKEYPLKKIFGQDFVFRIPPYQRPYSWTTEHAGELFEDLLNAMQNGAAGEPEPYFLGSVVLAKEESEPDAQVIDGQQRLTTLTILLSAIAATADDQTRKHLQGFLRQEGNPLIGMEDVYRVTLRPRDADFFCDHIQQEGGLAALLDKDPAQLTDPRANIHRNARLFMKRLGALTPPERERMAQYLLNSCYLVAVSTPDTDSAFKIFAVLNDRGLNLSHSDILKSELIGKVPDSEQDRYTTIWETAEEDLGIEPFADLFSHIRMIYARFKQRETLMKEFRDHVLPKIGDPRHFIDHVVSPYADIFATIRTQSWESTSSAEGINRTVGWLRKIDNVDWIPPAIRFLNEHKHESEVVFRFLVQLERLAASMFIRRVNINGRIDRYALLLKEMDGDGDVLQPGSALDLNEDEKRDTIKQLQGELYREVRVRGYVLLRLDEAMSAGGASYDHNLITVEHVLPQTPPAESGWTQWFSDQEREQWIHRLANLLLLPRRRNSAAQNFDFDRKKQQYFSDRDGTSPFAITTQVLTKTEWTPAVLEDRQQRLIRQLTDVWKLHPAEGEANR
jgi:hypothetical protein